MRNRFDEQLSQLNTELITMGALCEEAISGAAKYLIDNDSALKEKVIDTDKQIDRKERDIENLMFETYFASTTGGNGFKTYIRCA